MYLPKRLNRQSKFETEICLFSFLSGSDLSSSDQFENCSSSMEVVYVARLEVMVFLNFNLFKNEITPTESRDRLSKGIKMKGGFTSALFVINANALYKHTRYVDMYVNNTSDLCPEI